VRLGAQPLVDTITPKIVLRKGEDAKTQCEDAERKLLGSELLYEERVDFPGDEVGFELNWLGGAPFMQAQVENDLFEEDSDEYSSPTVRAANPAHLRRHPTINGNHTSKTRTNDNALALSLHVNLSEKTFISGLDTSAKVHLKIDVFFNGILSSCLFVPFHDVRSGTKSYHQVFAGHRVDFLAERPWIIWSPRSAEDKRSAAKHTVPAELRWKEVCRALTREANDRGMDKGGNVPPSAEFLKALATMQMPMEVRTLQKSGRRTFGVIDVVITAGDGRKVSDSVHASETELTIIRSPVVQAT